MLSTRVLTRAAAVAVVAAMAAVAAPAVAAVAAASVDGAWAWGAGDGGVMTRVL